jgi:hypothetical protein
VGQTLGGVEDALQPHHSDSGVAHRRPALVLDEAFHPYQTLNCSFDLDLFPLVLTCGGETQNCHNGGQRLAPDVRDIPYCGILATSNFPRQQGSPVILVQTVSDGATCPFDISVAHNFTAFERRQISVGVDFVQI